MQGDGKANDTAAITAALDLAERAGGGVVLLPAPGVFLSGPQHMRSHVVFRVELGATLLGSRIFTDYPYEWQPGALVLDGTLTRRSPGSKHRQSLVAGARCVEETANGTDCAVWKKLVNVTIDGGGIIDGQGTYLLSTIHHLFLLLLLQPHTGI